MRLGLVTWNNLPECLLLLALLLSLFVTVTASAGDLRRLSILHTNDLHARLLPYPNGTGGWAHLYTAAQRERANCAHCVFVHGGDLVQGTPVSTIFRGTPLFEISNAFQFDVGTLGNHEFDYGHHRISSYLRAAHYPIVNANIVDAAGRPITGRAYHLQTVNGIRIAFIGAMLSSLVDRYSTPALVGPWRVLPVVETVERVAKEVRDKADLIVVLGHLLHAEGSGIIRRVPSVSVVIEGHNHEGRKRLDVHESRVVANCPAFGVELCRLDLEFDRAQRKLVSWNWKRVPIRTSDFPADPRMQRLVDSWEAKVAALVDVPLARNSRDWSMAELKELLERAIRESAPADFAYVNEGGIRDDLRRGPVRVRDVWNVIPFDDRLAIARVRGSQVPAHLRMGRDLSPSRHYTLAMSEFAAWNRYERERIGIGEINFKSTGRRLRDVIIDWMRRQKRL